MTESSEPFRVLFVCTGNICRSAIAEQVLRARYESDQVVFTSAGTGALVGAAMPEQAAEISRRLGGIPDAHSGRQLTKPIVADSDLVIALTREHRSEIVRTHPRANRYTFTLREFARVLESYTRDEDAKSFTRRATLAETLRSGIPLIASQRGYTDAPPTPDDDDVIDPYRRPQEIYDRAGAEISEAIDRIAFDIEILRKRI